MNREPIPSAAGSLDEMAQCAERIERLGGPGGGLAREIESKIRSSRFDLVVAGQFKRGKTSLINALIGAELLPVAVVPLTSVVTILMYGKEPAAQVELDDGSIRDIDPATLAEYVTERGNPNNAKAVREARITWPSRWLMGGVRLIDTPGVGSIHHHNTEVAERFLPKSDAVIFVLSVDQPLSEAERQFLESVRRHSEKIFFVLNKADLLSAAELQESLAFTRKALADAIGSAPVLFPLSARDALAARRLGDEGALESSGMAPLLRALDVFLARDRDEAFASSVARQLHRAIELTRFDARLELRSLTAPLEELHAKLEAFRERKREILLARQDLEVLLGADAARSLQRPLESELLRFKEELAGRNAGEVDELYAKNRRLTPKALRSLLEKAAIDHIREAFDAWLARRNEETDERFAAFCARHSSRVDGIVSSLRQLAADLFSVPFATQDAASFRRAQSRFYYKFWSEPPALAMLASAFVHALPRSLAGPIVARNLRHYALDCVEMQAGRLRSDFSQRLDGAILELRREIDGRIEAAVTGIEAAIEKGLALRASGEARAGPRRAELEATLCELDEIEPRIEPISRR